MVAYVKHLLAFVFAFSTKVSSAPPSFDPKLILEVVKTFDPSMLTPSCRKVFNECKAHFVPLVMQVEQLLKKSSELLALECIQKELSKGFPRFDIECVMSPDFTEGIECAENPEFLEVVGPKGAKAVGRLTECIRDETPAA
ncbi:uncharacterized protein LOC144167416 [Haemaphysalis longicornis]